MGQVTVSELALGTAYTFRVDVDNGNPPDNMSEGIPSVEISTKAPFTTVWQTNHAGESESNQIKLPLVEGDAFEYDFTVDWGDDSIEKITSWDDPKATHTYTNAGQYTLVILGTLKGWSFGGNGTDYNPFGGNTRKGDVKKLTEVSHWGGLTLGATKGQFPESNFVITAEDAPDLSETKSMACMFYKATLFNEDIGIWNVSRVVNMDFMFESASKFNQNLNDWDVSSVTDMHSMFYGATSFDGNIGTWDVSKVRKMGYMFAETRNFNQDINIWDVSSVTQMQHMFAKATMFNKNLGGWDVSRVTTMYSMFFGATAFNQDIGSWNVSRVTLLAQMFNDATSFDQDIGSWNVSKAFSISDMFLGVTLSIDNYDALLNGWAELSILEEHVKFHGGNSKYSAGAIDARNKLIDTYKWTITDGGLAP